MNEGLLEEGPGLYGFGPSGDGQDNLARGFSEGVEGLYDLGFFDEGQEDSNLRKKRFAAPLTGVVRPV